MLTLELSKYINIIIFNKKVNSSQWESVFVVSSSKLGINYFTHIHPNKKTILTIFRETRISCEGISMFLNKIYIISNNLNTNSFNDNCLQFI